MALGTPIGTVGSGVANQIDFARWSVPLRSGIQGMAVTPSGTALTTVVAGGTGQGAWIHGVYVPAASSTNLTHTANGSSNARIDLIVVRANFATSTFTLVVLEGTPATSPVAPTPSRNLGGTFEEPIAEVTVTNTNGTFTAGAITDVRVDPATGVYATQTVRGVTSALARMTTGSLYTQGQALYLDDGTTEGVTVTSGETAYTPAVTGITGSLVRTGRWYRTGPVVNVRGRVAAPSSGSSALQSGVSMTITMPINHSSSPSVRAIGYGVWYENAGVTFKPILIICEPGSSVALVRAHAGQSSGQPVEALNPHPAGLVWSVANGSHFDYQITLTP